MSYPNVDEIRWAERFVAEFCDHDFLRPEQKQAIREYLAGCQARVRDEERLRTLTLAQATALKKKAYKTAEALREMAYGVSINPTT